MSMKSINSLEFIENEDVKTGLSKGYPQRLICREELKPCDIYSGYHVQRICDSVSVCAARLSGFALKNDETSPVF